MQIHQIKPIHKIKSRKRVGRGGKHGTFSGRGVKGQKARAGRKTEPIIRILIKRYPKLRGYKFKSRQKESLAIINIEDLKTFKSEDKVNPSVLLNKKIIRKIKGKIPTVKILGRGELTKKLIIEGCRLSKSAKEKIEKAEGQVI